MVNCFMNLQKKQQQQQKQQKQHNTATGRCSSCDQACRRPALITTSNLDPGDKENCPQ